MKKIKKRSLLSPIKFMSTCVYLVIISFLLLVLAYLYAQSELGISGLLGTPLSFAVAIMLCGFIATGVYWGFGVAVNAIVVVICKRETGIGGVLRLSTSETTLISIAACLGLGALFHELTLDNPDLAFFHQMLWSLPLGRLAFVNTKPTDLFSDCVKLLSEAKEVILYVILFIATMFIKCYAGSIATSIFWSVCGTLIIIAFFIKIPVRESKGLPDSNVSIKYPT